MSLSSLLSSLTITEFFFFFSKCSLNIVYWVFFFSSTTHFLHQSPIIYHVPLISLEPVLNQCGCTGVDWLLAVISLYLAHSCLVVGFVAGVGDGSGTVAGWFYLGSSFVFGQRRFCEDRLCRRARGLWTIFNLFIFVLDQISSSFSRYLEVFVFFMTTPRD